MSRPFSAANLSAMQRDVKRFARMSRPKLQMYGQSHELPRGVGFASTREGLSYRYSGVSHAAQNMADMPSVYLAHGVLSMLHACDLDSVLLNRYASGSDSVSWHCDDEAGMNPSAPIVSLSLGAARRFKMRRKDRCGDVLTIDLTHGDVLSMPPGVQATHEHCITKTKRSVGERVNLTFRSFL